jgi:pimeloyl-ACP methyl ester carboxylesterase
MPHAQTNDVNLYYEIHGGGPPLALIMGLGRTLAMWDRCFGYECQ